MILLLDYVGPCKKAVFACLATDVNNYLYLFFFIIMLFEADYAKNYASIMYQCLPET